MTFQKKRVVHIVEASATGTLSMASLLVRAQINNGHDVFVIFSRRSETPSDLSGYFDSSVNLLQIQMSSSLEKLNSLLQIRTALKKINPDIVYLHSSFAGFLGRLSSLFSLYGTRFFYIPHCISFMRKDIGYLKRFMFILFEWVAALKQADYVACSKSEQDAIKASIPFRKCHLVENALEFSSIPFLVNLPLAERKKTVITVGQIRTQKGPSIFAEIAQSVKRADPTVEFVWVGDGDSQVRRALEDSGVRVIGWVPRCEVWKYLGDARLYLSTSHWEGMPVSVIEASFAGIPVLVSACAGNVDVVEHEKTGWLYQTPAEAAVNILSALSAPDISQAIAKAAFDLAQQRFSVQRYFFEMEVLAQSPSR